MSLNTSALGASTLQMTIGGAGGSNGLLGTSRQNAGLDSHSALGFGGSSHSDTVNQLAGMLTGMMMMMSMMGGGGLTSLLGGGSGGGLGSMLGGGLGAGIGGALGGPLGASVGSSLGSGIGGSAASAAGSSLDQALGLNPTSYGDSSTSGSDSSADTSDPLQQLMKLFSEVMQSLFGDSQDATQGASTAGKQPTEGEQSAYKQGVTDALSALMGNGLSQSSGSAGLSDSAGTSLGGSSLSGKGLQNLSGPVDYQQLGNAIGTGVGMKAGIQALNDIGTHSDSPTRSFIDKGDRAMAKEVGQFMDQYPEVFGKPQYQKGPGTEVKTDDKSWAKALSKPDHEGMTPASMDQFNKAKGMIKSAMAGDSGNGNLQARGAGGASLGIDAMLTGDTINNMALSKLSVA